VQNINASLIITGESPIKKAKLKRKRCAKNRLKKIVGAFHMQMRI
jgi:hypothetical protein